MLNRFLSQDSLQDLQDIQEKVATLLRLSVVVIGADGAILTEPSSPYCGTLVSRTNSSECSKCIWCVGDEANIPITHSFHVSCPLGFEDFEIPILIDKQAVGYVVLGQAYRSPPQGNLGQNADLQKYLDHIPIYTDADRTNIRELFSALTGLITQVTFSRARDKETARLEIVRGLMFELSKVSDLQTMFRFLRNELPKLVRFDLFAAYLSDSGGRRLRREFADGFAEEALGEYFDEGEGYAGTVVKEKKKYLIVSDATTSDVSTRPLRTEG